MANVKKASLVEETTETVTNTTQKENDQLRAEMAEMKAQMEAMLKQMSQATPIQPVYQSTTTVDRDIEVISLTPSYLILTTNGKQDGIHYEFPKQYETVLISESDLKSIVRSMPQTARGGYFYINDSDFVKANKLASAYKVMLDDNGMSAILSLPVNEFKVKYNSVPTAQKSIIESMVVDKKLNGETVDANILVELGKITGKNYMEIEPLETEG